MTRLSALKKLQRLTGYFADRREQVVELGSSGLYVRGKGLRRRYFLSWADVFKRAVELTIARERAERKKQRQLLRRAA